MIGTTNGSYGQDAQTAPAQVSLTETLNESAKLSANILSEMNVAHERLFGRYPLGPQTVDPSSAKQDQPSAASLATLTLRTLREISAALGQLHHHI